MGHAASATVSIPPAFSDLAQRRGNVDPSHLIEWPPLPTDNPWGVPCLEPVQIVPDFLVAYGPSRQVAPALDANGCVHFYVYDHRFEPLWSNPFRQLEQFKRCGAVMTPDFTFHTDSAPAGQLWQHYRTMWMGSFWQSHGVTVIPTIGWGTENTFTFCFLGVPHGGVVSVSTVGVMGEDGINLFDDGYDAMIRHLEPSCVLWYGKSRGFLEHAPSWYPPIVRYAHRWGHR